MMITGIGTPSSQSKMPLPIAGFLSQVLELPAERQPCERVPKAWTLT